MVEDLRPGIAFRRAIASALLTLLLFLPNSVPAQTTSSPEEEKEETLPMQSFFAETTVTATGSKREVFDVATPVTVIRDEEIERKLPDNAADLLREKPGVDVNGVGPNQARPVIRGQRGHRVLFLENGLRLNNPRRQTDFGEITGLVDLQSVSSLEVVRGPASVLYGSDAIGGVLNVVSRNPVFGPGERFNGFTDLRYGQSGDLASGSAGVNAYFGRATLQFGGSLRRADDYSAPAGRFGNIRLQDEVIVRDSGVEDLSLWGSAGFSISERDSLRLRFNRYTADQTGFGFVDPDAIGEDESFRIRILYPEQRFERYTLSYSGTPMQLPWADSTTAQLYFQSNERDLVNDIDINIGPVAPGFPDSTVQADTFNFTDLDTWGLRADSVKALGRSGRHILTYGLDAYRDESYNTDFSRTTTTIRTPRGERDSVTTDALANAPNAQNTSWGIFVQDEFAAASRLNITAGLRYHSVVTRAQSTPGWDITALDFSDRDMVGAVTTTYQINDSMNVLASLGTAFRAPNIIERLFNGATPEGSGFQLLNPALTSERSQNWDLGFKYLRRNAFFEAVLFRNDIRDGIVLHFYSPDEIAALPEGTRQRITASGARFVVQQRNTDRLRYEGAELAGAWRSAAGLTLGGNFTWLDGQRTNAEGPATGDTYAQKIFAYARYQPLSARYWFEYNVRHNGENDLALDPNEPAPVVGRTLPSFTVHGLGAGVRLFEAGGTRHQVTMLLQNLTDELYAEFSNASFFRPEPGRNLKVSYRVEF